MTGSTTNQTELRVIGAGLGRTGTMSLQAALEELGFGPCYHLVDLMFNHPEAITRRDLANWQAITDGKPVDLKEVFRGYQSSLDWPTCYVYDRLAQDYPAAKVVLTVRDPEKWYESVISISARMRPGARKSRVKTVVRSLMMRLFVPRTMSQIAAMMNTTIWEGLFHGKIDDKDDAIATFQQHIEEVKGRIPPERLLIFNVKEGWEPLCAFLGVEVPDIPFPHINERSNFVGNTFIRQQQKRVVRRALAAFASAALLVALFVRFILPRIHKS